MSEVVSVNKEEIKAVFKWVLKIILFFAAIVLVWVFIASRLL